MKKSIIEYKNREIITFSVNINQIQNKAGVWKKNPTMYVGWQKFNLNNSQYNINHNSLAIKTGEESKLFVLDIDNIDHWNEFLLENERKEPKTAKVKSGSGGFHLYFKYTDDLKPIPNKAKVIDKKWDIDARSNGGCIYCPPSKYFNKNLNTEVEYKWVNGLDNIIEMPNWLKKVLLEAEFKEIKEKVIRNIKPSDLINFECKKDQIEMSFECIKDLVNVLNKERSNNYDDWINVCFALKSYSKIDLFSLFDDFSKKSDKYDQDSVINFWNNYKPNNN